MNHLRKFLIALAISSLGVSAFAGPSTDSLLTCLADNTTGRDRKELARWMFVAMAAHPEMHDLSSVTPATGDQASQSVALLLTHLLSESCPQEVRAARRADGSQAMSAAFESLGRLAMQELVTSKEVRSALTGFEKFIDRKKLESALGGP
jgi:hypothetical protein